MDVGFGFRLYSRLFCSTNYYFMIRPSDFHHLLKTTLLIWLLFIPLYVQYTVRTVYELL